MSDLPCRQNELMKLLRNPSSGNSLDFENGVMLDQHTGERFLVRNGIPVILRKNDVFGWNRRQQIGYDLTSPLYDLLYRFNIAKKWLAEIAEIMEVTSGEYILETSVGTGQQIHNIERNGVHAHFFGNDISYGMLRRCQKNLRRWDIDMGLVQGNAEALPFQSELFDVVFHVGGFNFFNDKLAAIKEMIRVAKPGAKLYIGDETDTIRDKPGRLARIVDRYMPRREAYAPPVELIPDDMFDVMTHRFLNGQFWLVAFRRP
jgi:ubiquinone/menaquinone biosynthesis C-methylase UbiE